jgi:hypothetical protein
MATAAHAIARRTLADLNETFRSTTETSDFEITIEYRVGRYALRISRDGYGSRGNGGKLLHLVIAHVITAIKPDYNWQAYCGEVVTRGRSETAERYVEQNARGVGAFESDGDHALDTVAINCNNCSARIFGETPEPRAKVEAREREARAAVKAANPPPTCPHCGDRRPRTKQTALEAVLCSNCLELVKTIAEHETGEFWQYCKPEERAEPWRVQRSIEMLDEAMTRFERREGKYL